MPRRPLDCASSTAPILNPQSGIHLAEINRFTQDYLLHCDYELQSRNTIETKRIFLQNLIWFHRHRTLVTCDRDSLRQFFVYLARGHEEPGGRFGYKRLKKPAAATTDKDYWVAFNGFFNWLVQENLIEVSPLSQVPKPRVPRENVEPFTADQIKAFLQAARDSVNPRRNEAIVLFLLDTGVRASEMCGLIMKNVDLHGRHAYVLGKGNKHRSVYFSRTTAGALARYVREEPKMDSDPVFSVDRGTRRGVPLTVGGLRQIIERLGQSAGIKARRNTTHTFRHTCALMMLRNGCNIYTLKELLGHSSLTTCQIYLKLSESDLATQHKTYSPVEGVRRS